MATTRIIPMHKNSGKSVQQTLRGRIQYAVNHEKTDQGTLVSCHQCFAKNAEKVFALTKDIYVKKTGRKQKSDVIAYQVRQSFKGKEVDPQTANEIGYKLAMEITKGKHAFIVATHIDTGNIHNHIIWNSTEQSCERKWRNEFNSSEKVAEISDRLCADYNLSVIKEPKSKGKNYAEHKGKNNQLNHSDKIRISIDEALKEKPKNFEEFLLRMQEKGYKIKRGKHISFLGNKQEKFIRLRSLGENYSEENIRAVIEKDKTHKPFSTSKKYKRIFVLKSTQKVSLVVDLTNICNAQKGKGFEQWAIKHNVQELAKTINFLCDNQIESYNQLSNKINEINNKNVNISDIENIDLRLKEISKIQKSVIQFAKTKPIQDKYKASGYSADFKQAYVTDLLLFKEAKNKLKELGLSKVPKMKDLKEEYASLQTEKKKLYAIYHENKKDLKDFENVKRNVDLILNINQKTTDQNQELQVENRKRSNDLSL